MFRHVFFRHFFLCLRLCLGLWALLPGSAVLAQLPLPPQADSAAMFLRQLFNWGHDPIYVFKDDNDGANSFAPHLEGNPAVEVTHCSENAQPEGRSNAKVAFHFDNAGAPFSIWRYTYAFENFGTNRGLDLQKATRLYFRVKGQGVVEALAGGTNRPPFYDPFYPFQDGLDVRSTGFISLTDDWTEYWINLKDSTFWVFLDSTAGANNKFPEINLMGSINQLSLLTSADAGAGHTCIRAKWTGNNASQWAGAFFFPPGQSWLSTHGYDLSEIQSVRFKAKLSQPGKIKALLGKDGDMAELSKVFTLDTGWTWITWDLPQNVNYSNIVGGFGFTVGGVEQTPSGSSLFLDSIHYAGVYLQTDLSQVITGFALAADRAHNPDSAVVYFDDVRFDTDRLDSAHFAQSFITTKNPLDFSQRNSAHTYDNALTALAFLALFQETQDEQYLHDARLIGDAFLLAMDRNPAGTSGPLLNVYGSGLQPYFDGTMKMPSWYDEQLGESLTDVGFFGSSTGNIAWAGLALLSLYDVACEQKYLDGARRLADWCLENTQTGFGFTGGLEGWPGAQQFATWKSTEHNLDLVPLLDRLYAATGETAYQAGADNARSFVQAMWSADQGCFFTGTTTDGQTPNTQNIPLDPQTWYVQALRDSTSFYTGCMAWARNNCYLPLVNNPDYPSALWGFDFNTDKDGIWYEGTAQAALSYRMLGQHAFADSLLLACEYAQSHGPRADGRGIVAADRDHVSTGFNWEYHNRLHAAPAAWYLFAKLCVNPYYSEKLTQCESVSAPAVNPAGAPVPTAFPNPFMEHTCIAFSLKKSAPVELSVFDMQGRKMRTLLSGRVEAGTHHTIWNGKTDAGTEAPGGIYACVLKVAGKKSAIVISRM